VYRFFDKKQRKTMLENTNMNGGAPQEFDRKEFTEGLSNNWFGFGKEYDMEESTQNTNLQMQAQYRLWKAQADATNE
jgi:hypothetical protein